MKPSTAILAAFVALLLAGASFAGGYLYRYSHAPLPKPQTDTVWRWHRDTVFLASSEPAGTVIVKVPVVERDTVIIARNDTLFARNDTLFAPNAKDSAVVEIPIERRTYTGEYYRAVVQGFRPELVEMDVRFPELPAPKRKWLSVTVGPQVGYGFTPAGWQPYAGLGVTAGITF